jgi:hypothetical protein
LIFLFTNIKLIFFVINCFIIITYFLFF